MYCKIKLGNNLRKILAMPVFKQETKMFQRGCFLGVFVFYLNSNFDRFIFTFHMKFTAYVFQTILA